MGYAIVELPRDRTMASPRVVEAVNYLIEAPNYASLINEITKIIETWDTHPMTYGGKLKCLNALIDVGLQDRTAFERLVKLIEDKRKLLPEVRRVDYQRDLMRERRARMAKALELHELRHGALRGAARMAQTQAIQKRWGEARGEHIAAEEAKLGRKLDWSERNEVVREFWSRIDTVLDKNLEDARRERKLRNAG